MAYSEIINEIQEQIDELLLQIEDVTNDIAAKEQEIVDLNVKLTNYEQQMPGLEQLKVNAQALIDSAGDHNINLNINVTSTGSGGSNDGNVVITTPTEM